MHLALPHAPRAGCGRRGCQGASGRSWGSVAASSSCRRWLHFLFDLDLKMREIATSLVAVVATVNGGGERVRRPRAGETCGSGWPSRNIDPTIGGILGGVFCRARLAAAPYGILFAAITLIDRRLDDPLETEQASSRVARKPTSNTGERPPGGDARRLGWEEPKRLAGAYFDEAAEGDGPLRGRADLAGALIALVAGALSGMLGIGGGFEGPGHEPRNARPAPSRRRHV